MVFNLENFEGLLNIDNFCKVLVKKEAEECLEKGNTPGPSTNSVTPTTVEEPLVDVFDEADHFRILVSCRCREQQVSFHPERDGVVVCVEECNKTRSGTEMCREVCRKIGLPNQESQLENMLFVIAKCNNNNTLEAMIPKVKQEPGNHQENS